MLASIDKSKLDGQDLMKEEEKEEAEEDANIGPDYSGPIGKILRNEI